MSRKSRRAARSISIAHISHDAKVRVQGNCIIFVYDKRDQQAARQIARWLRW